MNIANGFQIPDISVLVSKFLTFQCSLMLNPSEPIKFVHLQSTCIQWCIRNIHNYFYQGTEKLCLCDKARNILIKNDWNG